MLSDSVNVYTPGISQHSAAAGSSYFVTDAQGSLRGTHNQSTTQTNDIRFDAFGQQDFHGGAAPSALPLAWHQSSNYQTDNDSGLMLLGNRYYDSVVGRFISPDKVHSGNNWYAYCNNNPLGGVDPSGNVAQTINGGGVGSAMWVSMTGGASQLTSDMELYQEADQYNAQVDANKKTSAMLIHGGSLAGDGGTYNQMDGSFATPATLANASKYAGKNSPYGEPTFDFNFNLEDYRYFNSSLNSTADGYLAATPIAIYAPLAQGVSGSAYRNTNVTITNFIIPLSAGLVLAGATIKSALWLEKLLWPQEFSGL